MLVYEIVSWQKPNTPREPVSLTRFIAQRGGLRDETFSRRLNTTRGRMDARNRPSDLRAMGAHSVRGLIKARTGMGLDDAALVAWEEGYFPEHRERPDINELLSAIDDELHGKKRYSAYDENALAAYRAALAHDAQTDRYGKEEDFWHPDNLFAGI